MVLQRLLAHGGDADVLGGDTDVLGGDADTLGAVTVSVTGPWGRPRGLVDTTGHNCCKDRFDNLHLKPSTPTTPLHGDIRVF